MSSESESEQHSMYHESEEEQYIGLESENVESMVNSEGTEEEDSGSEEVEQEKDEKELDSENENVDSDIDRYVKENQSKEKKQIPLNQSNYFICYYEPNWIDKMIERHKCMKGKTLYVGFPCTFKDQTTLEKALKDLCSLAGKVRHSYKNNPRFCLVDFDSIEARTKAMNELKEVEINGKKLCIATSKEDDEECLLQLIEKKAEKWAVSTAKAKLKEISNATANSTTELHNKHKSICVKNIPTESKVSEIKALFPNAVDVHINFVKGTQNTFTATVTFPTKYEATVAKNKDYRLGENNLEVSSAITDKATNENQDVKMENKFDPTSGESVQQSPKSKGSKRKLEEVSNSESPSPKKKTKDIKDGTAKKTESLEKIEKKKIAKNLDNNEGVSKGIAKYKSVPEIKKLSKKKMESIHKTDNNITSKQKFKKEKLDNTFRFKKPRVST